MLFTLEALNAKEGDALLLHYGTLADPKLLVIDGGPTDVYRQTLKPRLREIKELLALEGPVPTKIVMVSHIDRDHIIGINDLFSDVEHSIEKDEEPILDAGVLWHNSFEDIVGNNQVSSISSFGAFLSGDPAALSGFPADDHSLEMIAGVGDGRTLRDLARRLSLPVNSPFDSYVQAGRGPSDIGGGLSVTIVGPSQTQLDNLREEWNSKVSSLSMLTLGEQRKQIAAFADRSVANLSSIVVYAESGGRTMLLTGDARGDYLLEGLEEANLLRNGKISIDLLKVPHHGSDRNVSTEFFRRVKAKHYVFSANGKDHNPDEATLTMLTAARRAERYTMYFTNRLKLIEDVVRHDRRANNRNYEVIYRDDDYYSVWTDLGDPLDY